MSVIGEIDVESKVYVWLHTDRFHSEILASLTIRNSCKFRMKGVFVSDKAPIIFA